MTKEKGQKNDLRNTTQKSKSRASKIVFDNIFFIGYDIQDDNKFNNI